MVEVIDAALPGVRLVRPRRHPDPRGWFEESWNAARWAEAGVAFAPVQDNLSRSRRNVLRGLHYQAGAAAQAKIVRVAAGRIFDVVLDLRRSSPTFGKWQGFTLSAEEGWQLVVPAHFAHGFLALSDECEVGYKVDAPYDGTAERAIDAADPALAIAWPEPSGAWLRSDKDAAAPPFAAAECFS